MKPIYFSICRAIVTHLVRGQQFDCELKNAFMTMRRLDKSMYGAILAGVLIFLLDFLQISVKCFSNVSLFLNFTPSNFSQSPFFYAIFSYCYTYGVTETY